MLWFIFYTLSSLRKKPRALRPTFADGKEYELFFFFNLKKFPLTLILGKWAPSELLLLKDLEGPNEYPGDTSGEIALAEEF